MFKLDKKNKYLIHSLLIAGLVFWFSHRGFDELSVYIALLIILVATLGTFVVQYPNIGYRHLLINNLLPIHLVGGALLTLIYFPNLGLPVKILFVAAVGIGFYIVSLVNNVFLVVEERREPIPLYRVAVTWVQIIIVIVAIPFFAGIFKMPYNLLIQNSVTALSSVLFSFYLIHMLLFDEEAKKVRGVEALLFSLFVGFCVFAAGVSVSFLPTETFLRALFVTSVLMFSLNYLYGYLKNSITKRLINESLLITFIFFLLLFVFQR
jgi:hypothetical protein